MTMSSSDLATLGSRIREQRRALGWSQEDLAERARVDRSYVGGVERGERNLTFTMLCQLATALHISVSVLVAGLPEGHDEVA